MEMSYFIDSFIIDYHAITAIVIKNLNAYPDLFLLFPLLYNLFILLLPII